MRYYSDETLNIGQSTDQFIAPIKDIGWNRCHKRTVDSVKEHAWLARDTARITNDTKGKTGTASLALSEAYFCTVTLNHIDVNHVLSRLSDALPVFAIQVQSKTLKTSMVRHPEFS